MVDKTIITITESRSMPGRFRVTKSGLRVQQAEGKGAAESAAVALEMAICCSGPYFISGSEKVMQHIPAQLRSTLK